MKTALNTQADAAPSNPAQEGALEQFIAQFNCFETEAELFVRCKDSQDFLWWDVVRYAVQFAIATEKDLVGARKGVSESQLKRAIRFLKQMAGLGQLVLGILLLGFKKMDTLYVSTRKLEEAAARIVSEDCRVLYVNKTGEAPSPHMALSKVSIDFLLRLITRMFSVPPEVVQEAEEIAKALKESFTIDANLEPLILSKYKEARATFWIWRIILARLPALKRVFFVNSDTLRPLVILVRERGLKTTEVQHGYMGRSHFAFSYPDLPFNLPTLPDEVWIMRDTGDITYPVPRSVLEVKSRPASTKERDIDVLVGGSPTRSEEMRDTVKALVESGLKVAVKLHPAQTEESSGLRALFSADELTIFAGDENFVSLAERSQVFVPVNPTSTTVFEAVDAGADLIVLNKGGHKITNMCDAIAAAQVESFEALCHTVQSYLKENGK